MEPLLSEVDENVECKEKETIESNLEFVETPKTEVTMNEETSEIPENEKEFEEKTVYAHEAKKSSHIVKRGSIYWCNLGEAYGSEQGGRRPVVIIQNDYGNIYSPTTIVLPISSKVGKQLPTHFSFKPSSESIVNYNPQKCKLRRQSSVILAEQIRTVDKTRLYEYIGKFTSKFMEELQLYIEISLGLRN